MADDEKQEDRVRIEIPTTFSLKEQLEEITSTYKTRRDFIEGRHAAGKPVAPSYDLARYSLARLKAIGDTIRALYEDEKAATERRRQMEASGDDGF